MKITNEIKKQKAIELMNKLNIYKPYICGFENDNMVCFFENFGGLWTILKGKTRTFILTEIISTLANISA